MNSDSLFLAIFVSCLLVSALRASQKADGTGWGFIALVMWVVLMFRGCA